MLAPYLVHDCYVYHHCAVHIDLKMLLSWLIWCIMIFFTYWLVVSLVISSKIGIWIWNIIVHTGMTWMYFDSFMLLWYWIECKSFWICFFSCRGIVLSFFGPIEYQWFLRMHFKMPYHYHLFLFLLPALSPIRNLNWHRVACWCLNGRFFKIIFTTID